MTSRTRIAGAKIIRWESSSRITIGHHTCQCGVETPTPPEDVQLEFAKIGGVHLWPMDTSTFPTWMWTPVGWTMTRDGCLCPECSTAVAKALAEVAASRKGEKRP